MSDDVPKDDPLFKNPIKPPHVDQQEMMDRLVGMLDKAERSIPHGPPPEPFRPENFVNLNLTLTLSELIVVARALKELRNEK